MAAAGFFAAFGEQGAPQDAKEASVIRGFFANLLA